MDWVRTGIARFCKSGHSMKRCNGSDRGLRSGSASVWCSFNSLGDVCHSEPACVACDACTYSECMHVLMEISLCEGRRQIGAAAGHILAAADVETLIVLAAHDGA